MSTNRPKLVLLGTAGGPLPSPTRSGIAQALVVDGRTYVVDCGSGVARQLRRARLLAGLHQVFITHLHSDHTCDYFNLFLLGWPILQWNPPVHVWGPSGLVAMTEAQLAANAYDLRIRVEEAGRHDLAALIVPHEIACAEGPVEVFEDSAVRVSATLVSHAPVFPAYAFRFDTADGSVVFSGDTAPCAELVRLATGADVLVHEVFDDTPAEDPEDSWEENRQRHHLVTSHTPLSRVGQVASEAGVKRLVLTHFVPGDDELPDAHWLDGVRAQFDGEVVVGHDLLEMTIA